MLKPRHKSYTITQLASTPMLLRKWNIWTPVYDSRLAFCGDGVHYLIFINRFSLSKYVYVANFIKTNLKTLIVRYDDVWLLSDAPDVSFKHNGCISLIRITQRPPADHMANIICGVSTILLMGWCVFRHKCTTRSCTRTNLISVTANLQQRKWL